jgi:hypothetical protein
MTFCVPPITISGAFGAAAAKVDEDALVDEDGEVAAAGRFMFIRILMVESPVKKLKIHKKANRYDQKSMYTPAIQLKNSIINFFNKSRFFEAIFTYGNFII